MSHRALFLDRDGVISHLVYYASHDEWEAPRHPSDLSFIPGVFDAMREAQAAGWKLFLITNQPSYAKGKCPLEDLQQVHAAILSSLSAEAIEISAAYACYHHPESEIAGHGRCTCRKPSPESLLRAARDFDLDLGSSWMAGDQDTDIQTGRAAGVRTALIQYAASAPKRGATSPDLLCADLSDFVQRIGRANERQT